MEHTRVEGMNNVAGNLALELAEEAKQKAAAAEGQQGNEEAAKKAAAEAEAKAAAAKKEQEAPSGGASAGTPKETKEEGTTTISLTDEEKADVLAELDGDSFNEAGDILDKDGKVIATSAELLEALKATPTPSLIDEAVKLSGHEFKNEKGEPVKFEETPEGVVQLAKNIADKFVADIKKREVETNPDLKRVYQHLALHGNLNDFNKGGTKQSFRNLTLTEDTPKDTYVDLIIKDLVINNGMAEDRATKLAGHIVEEGTWKQEGKDALSRLNVGEAKREEQEQEAVKNAIKAQEASNAQYWGKVEETIKKGALPQGIKIPETDKNGFFDYLAKPIDARGLSQELLDRQSENMETQVLYSYLRYKKLNLNDLIQTEVQNKRVLDLRERMKAIKEGKPNGLDSLRMKRTSTSNVDNFPDVSQFK